MEMAMEMGIGEFQGLRREEQENYNFLAICFLCHATRFAVIIRQGRETIEAEEEKTPTRKSRAFCAMGKGQGRRREATGGYKNEGSSNAALVVHQMLVNKARKRQRQRR